MHVQYNFSLFGYYSSKFRFSNFICPSVFCAVCLMCLMVCRKMICGGSCLKVCMEGRCEYTEKQSRTVSNGWSASLVWWAGGA